MKFISVILFIIGVSICNGQTFNVMDFGAKGDGTTKDTIAIVKAIAAIANNNGGELYFPPGKYLTAPVNLTSNIVVNLDPQATILGSTDISDWEVIVPLPSYCQGRELPGPRYTSLIHAEHEDNITITGGGTIDGQGQIWWTMHQKNELNYTRGRLIQIMYADGIFINHVTLINSPFWTVHPYSSNNVVITDVVINNPSDSPNTDGIDPDSCSNVYIARCNISDGDDCIAIKSGIDYCGREYNKSSENILIEDCVFGSGHGISIGSEMSGGVRNVTVRNCVAVGTQNGARIKTQRGRGGIVEDITFSNITLNNVLDDGIIISMFYSTLPPTNKTGTPIFRNINIKDYYGDAAKVAGNFDCLPESPCTGVVLENINLQSKDGFNCTNIQGTSSNVSPKICF